MCAEILKGTSNLDIWFEYIGKMNLHDYHDSEWAKCVNDSKQTSSYVLPLGFKEFY